MVTVESESTESILMVEVKLVMHHIEFSSTNCKIESILKSFLAHPGYFGKKGMRHFHLREINTIVHL